MTIDRYESLEYDGRLYSEISDLESKIDDLQHQLEQKENIIKEVREYIEKASYFQGNKVLNEKELLEILDKENKQ